MIQFISDYWLGLVGIGGVLVMAVTYVLVEWGFPPHRPRDDYKRGY